LSHHLTYWGEVVQDPCHPSCHQQRQNCHAFFTVSCLTVSPTGVKLSKFLAIHHVTNKGKTVTLCLLSVVSPSHLPGWSCPSSLPSIMSPTKAKLSHSLYCQLSHLLGWSCPSSLPSIMLPTKAKLSGSLYCQLSHPLGWSCLSFLPSTMPLTKKIIPSFFFLTLLHHACWFNHFFTVPTNAHLYTLKTLRPHILSNLIWDFSVFKVYKCALVGTVEK